MAYAPSPDKLTLLNVLLLPLSSLYWLGWKCYELIYRLGIKKPAEVHDRILVIGNLIAGGAGKSPLTRATADLLIRHGESVVLGVSGYGSPMSHGAQLAPEGSLSAAEYGDEAAMLRDYLPNIPMIVGRARVTVAQICHKLYPNSILLMDDGFQHKPLKKSVAVLVDIYNPKNPFVLPAGPYREPRSNLKLADITFPGDFQLIQLGIDLVDPFTNQMVNHPESCNVLSSIARPERLLSSIEELSIKPCRIKMLPDHFPLQTLEWPFHDDLPVIVTAKDWVKLRERSDIGSLKILVAQQRVQINEEEAYLNRIIHELNQ